MNLIAKEVMDLIKTVGPRLGHDSTSSPLFPEGRTDVCVVVHSAEDGHDYGFDTVYLVWKEPDGSMKHKEIKNSRSTKDYISVESVAAQEDGGICVKFGSGGSYSGVPWSESMKADIKSRQVRISQDSPSSYPEQAQQAMLRVINNNSHDKFPFYKRTAVKESAINTERKSAVFVLFEQIDTDRASEDGEGYLGDHFRYSLWKMGRDCAPVRIYEDHAWMNPYGKPSLVDGRNGKVCILQDLRLEYDAIKVTHLKGRVEQPESEELSFSI